MQTKQTNIIQVAECALGNNAANIINKLKYGIICKDDTDYNLLELLIFAAKSGCVEDLCNIENTIGKILKYCKDCKPKRYKEPIITYNTDYTCWYSSQEYLDCLEQQLIDQGWIEPAINICNDLNIHIDINSLCSGLGLELSMMKIDCLNITNIDIEKACNRFLTSTILTNTLETGDVLIPIDYVLIVNSLLVDTDNLRLNINIDGSTYELYSITYFNGTQNTTISNLEKDELNNLYLPTINTFEWYGVKNSQQQIIITGYNVSSNNETEDFPINTIIEEITVVDLPFIYEFQENCEEHEAALDYSYFDNVVNYTLQNDQLEITNFIQPSAVLMFYTKCPDESLYFYWLILFKEPIRN